jgi:hypothetical protein
VTHQATRLALRVARRRARSHERDRFPRVFRRTDWRGTSPDYATRTSIATDPHCPRWVSPPPQLSFFGRL